MGGTNMLITTNANANTSKLEGLTVAAQTKGHLYALWMICFPLMLSALSGSLMLFFDRIILAKYDTNAMIAATTAGNISYIFQFGAMSITMIAEVFVGQFNGAQQFKNIGKPVWQMIWFSLMCGIIMVPMGLFGQSFFIPAELGADGYAYFKWMMILGVGYPLVGALTSFFVGRGQVKVIAFSVLFANILNLVLVTLLVFGVPGIIPSMGAEGASIATGVAQLCVAIGLFICFLKSSNRKQFHTHLWKFDYSLFIKCIKTGLPNSIGHMAAYSAWAFVMFILAKRSLDHVTVVTIGFSIWMLFSFITEGLQMGVTAMASNHIGAKKWESVKEVLIAGLRLQFILALVLAIPLVIMPGFLVEFFIPINDEVTDISHMRSLIELSCRWLWLAYLFDGMAWVVDGILTAGGDTRFIMFMNSLGTWIFCIVPIYFFVIKMEGEPILTLKLITVYCVILFSSYYLRYKTKKWKNNLLITN